VFFARVGFWLETSKLASERIILTVLICSTGGVCWVELLHWVDTRRPQPAKQGGSSATQQGKPPTLVDLFKSEFGNTMKFADEDRIGFKWADGNTLKIKTQVYADFPAKTQFVSFYVASSPWAYDACLGLVDAVQDTITGLPKRIAVSAGYRDERSRLEDLTFSGRVILYHEDFLSIPQKAAIMSAYAAKHFDVHFRGPSYLGDQVVAWHHQHDAMGAH
jgi:hypothetical protein